MGQIVNNEIIIKARQEDYNSGRLFIENYLRGKGISSVIVDETVIVFESIFDSMLLRKKYKNTDIHISGHTSLGDVRIKMAFAGESFSIDEDDGSDISPEGRIIQAYEDKIETSYHSGRNRIIISVRRSHIRTSLPSTAAMLLAIAVFLPLRQTLGTEQSLALVLNYMFPLERCFLNAVLMVGAPVTFLSLLKNLTDAFLRSENARETDKLLRTILYTSVVAIILAAGTIVGLSYCMGNSMAASGDGGLTLNMSAPEFIESVVPPSLFEAFVSISPFPLLVIAVLTAYACCSIGKYFDSVKKAVDACYALLSRMLSIVMFFLPLACFLAFGDALLDEGAFVLVEILAVVGVVAVGSVIMILYYAARLRARGISPLPFFRKMVPMLQENLKISTTIDSAPYNIRYCTRVYGMNRRALENVMPVLAQLNLNGNCSILMLISMSMIVMSGSPLQLSETILIGIIVLFLSLGAPNQPGSILIGLSIIINYLEVPELICFCIYSEVLFGSLLNIHNVIGNMVDFAILEKTKKASA